MLSKLAVHRTEVEKPKTSHLCWLLLSAFGEDFQGRDELRKELPGAQVVMK